MFLKCFVIFIVYFICFFYLSACILVATSRKHMFFGDILILCRLHLTPKSVPLIPSAIHLQHLQFLWMPIGTVVNVATGLKCQRIKSLSAMELGATKVCFVCWNCLSNCLQPIINFVIDQTWNAFQRVTGSVIAAWKPRILLFRCVSTRRSFPKASKTLLAWLSHLNAGTRMTNAGSTKLASITINRLRGPITRLCRIRCSVLFRRDGRTPIRMTLQGFNFWKSWNRVELTMQTFLTTLTLALSQMVLRQSLRESVANALLILSKERRLTKSIHRRKGHIWIVLLLQLLTIVLQKHGFRQENCKCRCCRFDADEEARSGIQPCTDVTSAQGHDQGL